MSERKIELKPTGALRQQSEQRFRSGISQIKDYAIFSIDPAGVITTWNEGCKHVLGYDEAEFIGLPAKRLFTPEDVADGSADLELQTAAASGTAGNDRWMIRKNGERFWASGTTTGIHDEDGEVVGFTKVMRDVTQQQRAEQEVRNSLQRVQLLSGAARNLLEMDDPLELIARAYDALAPAFGLDFYFHFGVDPQGECLRLRASRGISPAIAQQIEKLEFGEAVCGRVARDLQPIVIADVQQSQDPMTRFIRRLGITAYACHPLVASGRLLGTLSFGTHRHPAFTPELMETIRALTDMVSEAIARQQADATVEATAAQFRLLVEAAPNGMVMVNERGVITMVNAQMERLFGYERAEMLGQPIEMLLPERYRARHPAQRQEFHESPQTRAMGHGRDLFGRRKDGSEFPVEVGLNPADTPTGRVVLAAVVDITRRKRAEEALAKAHAQLEDKTRSLEEVVAQRTARLQSTISELEAFSYSLAHDMRQPLRTIQSFSQIVLAEAGEKIGAPETELLHTIIRAASRLDRLIRDVLTYTRLSRDRIDSKTVDVEKLVQQIVAERPELQSPKAQVEIESPLPHVRGHEGSLTQCITNLLDNAVKFVAPGTLPHVRIRSEPVDGQVRFWFEDNGIGIPTEAQQRMFGIFQRIHSDQAYPGTGLGLAVVRKAVERMNGTVGVESEPGQGSRFWVQLPGGT